MDDETAWRFVATLVGEDDIGATSQRAEAGGDGFVGNAPHEHRFAHCDLAEMFHVIWQMPGQPTPGTDEAAAIHGEHEGDDWRVH